MGLLWNPINGDQGFEARFTAPALRRDGTRTCRVWRSQVNGSWWAGVMEWDADQPVDGPDAGKAMMEEIEADAIRRGTHGTYRDSLGRTWESHESAPDREARCEIDANTLRARWDKYDNLH